MKYDLLKMTQLILSSMDSDEVNSISDTTESLQVVDIIEQTYNDIASQVDFPDHWDLFSLQASGDTTRPTVMYLPENVTKVEWIQYDIADSGDTVRDLKYMTPVDREFFFERMNGIDSADSNVYRYDYLVGTGDFDVRGYNDKDPSFYTTTDAGRTLIFDNYQVSQGTTLIATRTKCYGQFVPAFTRDDDWVAEFEPKQFSLFFNEAKAQCFLELKQVQNAKAEQRARRGWTQAGRKKPTTDNTPVHHTFTYDFGRRRAK